MGGVPVKLAAMIGVVLSVLLGGCDGGRAAPPDHPDASVSDPCPATTTEQLAAVGVDAPERTNCGWLDTDDQARAAILDCMSEANGRGEVAEALISACDDCFALDTLVSLPSGESFVGRVDLIGSGIGQTPSAARITVRRCDGLFEGDSFGCAAGEQLLTCDVDNVGDDFPPEVPLKPISARVVNDFLMGSGERTTLHVAVGNRDEDSIAVQLDLFINGTQVATGSFGTSPPDQLIFDVSVPRAIHDVWSEARFGQLTSRNVWSHDLRRRMGVRVLEETWMEVWLERDGQEHIFTWALSSTPPAGP